MIRYAAAAAALVAAPALAAPALSPVWSDHAVIQRGQPVIVEGTARAGEKVSGRLGSAVAAATAGRDGLFTLTFPARLASSHPITLTVSGADGSATVNDLLVGDVWLCGGQSNMEFSVGASAGGQFAIRQSNDHGLRLLMIPKTTALTPQRDFGSKVAWAAAAPETVKDFSGACYYMARQLRRDLKIPIGAIHSNWGGSQIRAWETPESALALYGPAAMAQLRQAGSDPLGAVTGFATTWEDWWRSHAGGAQPWLAPDKLAWTPVPQMSAWGEWKGTRLAENGNGNVWFRRTFTLTPAQAKAGGTLNIGVIDDTDMTFVNGRPVGNTSSWSDERHYKVPAAYLKPGANDVMVLITNSYGAGGMESKPDRLALEVAGGASIPLGDGWRYSISPVTDYPPRSPWDGIAGIGVMYNRMIAPFGHYRIAGMAWYQGESDVGIPDYAERLKQLFAGWRKQFGPGVRMLVVQLPNWGPVEEHPTASGWAEVRNDEYKAVAADKNAALIPTLDIGENNNLHPLDKLEVGLRLAMAAEGKPLPLPTSAKQLPGLDYTDYELTFSGVQGGLHAWSGPPLGFELCAETQASCRYAKAVVKGGRLVISNDLKPATRVRYAWIDSPVVNLYDARALPVPGFELPITQ